MRPAVRRTPIVLLLALALAAAMAFAVPAAAQQTGAPEWAPIGEATITPGVQTFTEGGQCTANFVFYDAPFGEGSDIYIGQSAHCSGTGGQTATNGCDAGSLPLGTPVEIQGASQPGELVYNSWLTMQSPDVAEDDPNTCLYNDFALVRIDPADHDKVNPTIPVIGGPFSINRDGVGAGEFIHSYGNSSLRLGITQLSPKLALSLGTAGGGWTHPHYAVSPGIPGDSGSAFVDDDGNALGVLSTLTVLPTPLSNNATDLGRAFDYMLAHSGLDVELALATSPDFTPLTVNPLGGLLGGGLLR
jgi:hypothetical protein